MAEYNLAGPPPPDPTPESELDFDFYAFLGLETTAKKSDIKDAHKRLALKYHPDKNRDDPDAPANFRKLRLAYSVLYDGAARAAYDEMLEMKRLRAENPELARKQDEEKAALAVLRREMERVRCEAEQRIKTKKEETDKLSQAEKAERDARKAAKRQAELEDKIKKRRQEDIDSGKTVVNESVEQPHLFSASVGSKPSMFAKRRKAPGGKHDADGHAASSTTVKAKSKPKDSESGGQGRLSFDLGEDDE
eukprot:TRINITY_DN14684_c0_g1_i1.p2 TRINITY_DN14684_c0_g1~~TRINITY_DN14684_c0_g1_i1.p2  ORF type:complete len:249 (+),score=127.24 TRINITY_DN14684_c0_g1_i1:264-1010(+)